MDHDKICFDWDAFKETSVAHPLTNVMKFIIIGIGIIYQIYDITLNASETLETIKCFWIWFDRVHIYPPKIWPDKGSNVKMSRPLV